jgi:hypothetical protein
VPSTSPSPARCSWEPGGPSLSWSSPGSSQVAGWRGAPRRSTRPGSRSSRRSGARVACRTAGPLEADAALLLSFPLHPPGQPEKLRAHELALAPDPTWVVQGEVDAFGTPEEVRAFLPAGAVLLEVPGGHSFPKGSRSALTTALTSVVGMLPG